MTSEQFFLIHQIVIRVNPFVESRQQTFYKTDTDKPINNRNKNLLKNHNTDTEKPEPRKRKGGLMM